MAEVEREREKGKKKRVTVTVMALCRQDAGSRQQAKRSICDMASLRQL